MPLLGCWCVIRLVQESYNHTNDTHSHTVLHVKLSTRSIDLGESSHTIASIHGCSHLPFDVLPSSVPVSHFPFSSFPIHPVFVTSRFVSISSASLLCFRTERNGNALILVLFFLCVCVAGYIILFRPWLPLFYPSPYGDAPDLTRVIRKW